ncbi:MAG: hypothetical protein ACYTG7_12120 [Planctomycetota bacterium]|jgi:hypothetical protein
MYRFAFFLLVTVAVTLPACVFERVHVNPGVRDLDTSNLKVGETTWREVLRELGPPNMTTPQDNPLKNISKRHLKYAFRDSKTTSFMLFYLLLLTFSWEDSHPVHELLIEFDEKGVVSGIFLSTTDTIWTPLTSEDSREPGVRKDLTKEHM